MTMKMLLSILFVSSTLAEDSTVVNLFIDAPTSMEALNGSCLLIPCNFRARLEEQFKSDKKTFGVWMKNDPRFAKYPENVIFNSSTEQNIYPMSILGNLSEKNCTTLFSDLKTSYQDEYFFRIENSPFMATAVSNSCRITIKESPWKPTINISGDLREKNSVSFTCSALTPCPHSPPRLTWNLQQATSHTEENPDRTLTTKIQETITLSDSHDGNNITCSASYPVDGGQRVKTAVADLTLNVKYAPKDTSASISPGSGLVSAGHWVNLTCSSRAKPPISSFTWFKISNQGGNKVSEGDFYSFNVTADTDGGRFFCVAANELGNQSSQVILLTTEGEDSGALLQWKVVLGSVIGIVGVLCFIFFVWWLKCGTEKQPETQTGEGMIIYEPTTQTRESEENLHYGKIDFSRWRPGPDSRLVRDSDQHLHTVYAEVNVNTPKVKTTEAANGSSQTADDLQDLYAQVKKK